MSTIIQQKRGTAAQWSASSYILSAGEFGWETDTNRFKIGNGSNSWSSLAYAAPALSHVHGNISNDGAIGTTANLVAVTGTSGILTVATSTNQSSTTFLRGDLTWVTPTDTNYYPTAVTMTAGTTAGPIVGLTMNSGTVTSIAIPSAASGASGIITTSAQTLDGVKTFTSFPQVSSGLPSNSLDLVNKQYVDNIASGINAHDAIMAATTVALTATYNNNTNGIGATLTNSGTQTALVIDNVSLNSGDRVLVKNQGITYQNGIYTVTTVGDGSTNWVLTRASDYDQSTPGEVAAGDTTFVVASASQYSVTPTQNNTSWTMNNPGTITIGSSAITFVQTNASSTYTAGTGINITTGTISVDSTIPTLSASNTFTVGPQTVNTGATTNRGLVVNAPTGTPTSQVIQAWQLNGSDVATVTANGLISTTGRISTGGAIGSKIDVATSTSTIGVGVRGNSTQTGDLIQLQNSSSTILSGFNAAGQLYTGATSSKYGSTQIPVTSVVASTPTTGKATYTVTSSNVDSVNPFVVGQLVNIGSGFSIAGYSNVTALVTDIGGSSGAWTFAITNATTGAATGSANVSLYPAISAVTPSPRTSAVVIQGVGNQQANLQEWQDSAGAILSRIERYGALNISPNTSATGYAAFIKSPSPTVAVLQLRGAASQTTNLQEWQDSSSNKLLAINSAGQFQSSRPDYKSISVKAAGTLTGTITAATASGGTVTYTANNTFASGQIVTITGVVSTGNSGATAGAGFNLTGATIATASATQFTITNALSDTYTSGGTATVAQSANIQDWQDGSGSVLASLGSSGTFFTTGRVNIGGSIGSKLDIATSSAVIGIGVRGNSVQTGDLFQLQNASATVLGGRNAVGQIYTGSTTPFTSTTFTQSSLTSAAYVSATSSTFTYNLTTQVAAIGQTITIAGVTGGNYNQVVTVTAIGGVSGAYTFTATGTGFTNVAGTGGNFYLSPTGTGTTARVYLVSASNLAVGDLINVSSFTGVTAYNTGTGIYTLVTGVSNTSPFYVEYSSTATGTAINGQIAIPPQASITARSAGTRALVIQAAPSQVANLTNWVNSSGTTLSSVTPNGTIVAASLQTPNIVNPTDTATNMVISTGRNIQMNGSTAGFGGGAGVLGLTNATTVPTSNSSVGGIMYVESGALKYRGTASTAGMIVNSDGTLPPGVAPRYLKTGFVYAPNGLVTYTNQASNTLNTLYAVPFYVPYAATATSLSVSIGALNGASSVVRLGIYNNSTTDDYPGTLLLDAGTILTDTVGGSTGINTLTISQALTPGLYWLVGVRQGTGTPSVSSYNSTGNYASSTGYMPYGTTTSLNAPVGWSMTGVTGALSATAATFSGTKTMATQAYAIWIGF